MKTYPTPICEDTYAQAFEHIEWLTARNSRLALVRKIVLPIGVILFLLGSLLMTFGAFYGMREAEDEAFFALFPFLVTPWKQVEALLAIVPAVWYVQMLVRVAAVFVLPLMVSLVLTLLVCVLYRGKRVSIPEGTPALKAKGLHELAVKIPRSKFYYDSGHTTAATLCSLFYVLAVAGFLVFAMIKGSYIPTAHLLSAAIGLLVCALIVFFLYRLLCRLFITLNGLFYAAGKIPSSIVADTDAYWLSLDPAEAKRREEEEKKAQASAAAAKARAIASGKACAKCGGKLGLSGGYEVSGKTYCWECSKKVPRTHVDYQCYQCAYYHVDENYDGHCRRDYDRIVDRYKTACTNFSKR